MAKDEELYHEIKRGNMSAFDILYGRYQLRLFRFIFGYLKHQEEAEEVFHEAFMKVLKSDLLEFNSGTFQAWIFEVSRNLCLNRMRTSVRASRGLEKLPSLIDAVESAESLLSNHEDASQVKEALKKLSETHAEILHLKLLGVSEKDIARSLQIPLGTVKSRFHSIVKFLKQEVRGESN